MPLLQHLGQHGLSPKEIRDRAGAAIEELIERARRSIAPSNEGHDIASALGAARQKLSSLDTQGAVSLLAARLADEEETRRHRLIPLLREKAAIERISYDYDAAKTTLKQLVALDPNAVGDWVELGDLFVTTGPLADAQNALVSAADAAQHGHNDRDLSVSKRIGDVQVAQGDLAGALKSYRDSLAIARAGWRSPIPATPAGSATCRCRTTRSATCRWRRATCRRAAILRDGLAISDRLAKSDPGNAGWQRDLSVSHNKVGDVQVAQGDLAGALQSYRDSLAIATVWRNPIPATPAGSATCRCRTSKVGDVQVAQGDLRAR